MSLFRAYTVEGYLQLGTFERTHYNLLNTFKINIVFQNQKEVL
jgi:hypothetical protein